MKHEFLNHLAMHSFNLRNEEIHGDRIAEFKIWVEYNLSEYFLNSLFYHNY